MGSNVMKRLNRSTLATVVAVFVVVEGLHFSPPLKIIGGPTHMACAKRYTVKTISTPIQRMNHS